MRVNGAEWAKILGREARATPRRAARPRPEPVEAPCRWRCFTCGLVSTAYKPAERHADAERHRRIIFDLSGDV